MLEKNDSQIYSAYGLNVNSAVPLPDLSPSDGSPDVKITFGNLTDDFLLKNLGSAEIFERRGCRIRTSARAMLLEWEAVGKVFVRGGREVIVEVEAAVSDADLQPFLTGPVLSVVLHQRGNLVLHASAVLIGGTAAVFLGAKGEGKSTLAAYLQTNGHRLISDDIVPVSLTNNRIETFAGYPKIKLFADAVEAVGASTINLPLIHRRAGKFSFGCAENHTTAPIPLGAIYVLTSGDDTKIKKLDLKSAFIELTRHSHLNKFLKALNNRRTHFEQCHKLVQSVPVYQLQRPRLFEKMPEINRLLEENSFENSQSS